MTFEDEWARCSPWLQAAIDHAANTHDLADVEAMVRSGEAHAWFGRNAALVTQIIAHPNFKALHLWLAGGDLDDLTARLRPEAETWAKAHHAVTKVTLLGRPGWERVLKSEGYVATSRLLVKEL